MHLARETEGAQLRRGIVAVPSRPSLALCVFPGSSVPPIVGSWHGRACSSLNPQEQCWGHAVSGLLSTRENPVLTLGESRVMTRAGTFLMVSVALCQSMPTWILALFMILLVEQQSEEEVTGTMALSRVICYHLLPPHRCSEPTVDRPAQEAPCL